MVGGRWQSLANIFLGAANMNTNIICKVYIQTCNLSQTLHGYDFRIICLPKKCVNYNKLCLPTKQCKLYFT